MPRILGIAVAPTVTLVITVAAWHFPYATDDPIRREVALSEFYELVYASSTTDDTGTADAYAEIAAAARENADIVGQIRRFVEMYDLHRGKVLDVGSGSGYLQDIVDDYTGLDISSAAAAHYHKAFVHGTATAMPFADATFDAVWSVWVLEHIPNPEAALAEIRRVVKPGGLIYLRPAWNCVAWAAEGYAVRPYSDFGLGGKLLKASIPIQRERAFQFVATVPNRFVRSAAAISGRPTRLHYRRLTPNYETYWQADSDAVNSLDFVETAMWFESRGDVCLNCLPGMGRYFWHDKALIIRRNEGKVTS